MKFGHFSAKIKFRWSGAISPVFSPVFSQAFYMVSVIFTLWHEVKVDTSSKKWSFDKTYTFMFDKAYTMKPWQNIYDEIMTKHIRSLRWRNHENSWGEKRGEKTGEMSPLHLNIIFTEFSNKILSKIIFRAYACFPRKTERRDSVWKSWISLR